MFLDKLKPYKIVEIVDEGCFKIYKDSCGRYLIMDKDEDTVYLAKRVFFIPVSEYEAYDEDLFDAYSSSDFDYSAEYDDFSGYGFWKIIELKKGCD